MFIKATISIPAIGARMKNHSEVKNLEKHFNRKDAGEDVVKVGQHQIPDYNDKDDHDANNGDNDEDSKHFNGKDTNEDVVNDSKMPFSR